MKAVIIMATPRSKSLHGKGGKCIARNIYQVLESPLGDGAEFPTAMFISMLHCIGQRLKLEAETENNGV